ncbi:unnamed protein product [Periconia digitata]|uniref:GPI inositol-deacylase n=1 Tax=Periconia digitata TaxID=1303443 RepID=A0A9W4TYV7_9PLEO|nr:unnamed protein product [Periconia digitata]
MYLKRVSFLVALLSVFYGLVERIIPSRLQPAYTPSSPFGLVRADNFDAPGRAHGIDIIFVHGLGSNPDTTWGPKDGNWVNRFLPEDIPLSLRNHTRIYFYNYETYYKRDAIQARLRTYGEHLISHINLELRSTEEERTRDLLLVGHSYGGLVIKQALLEARHNKRFVDIFRHVKAIFFLGTPHRGSHFSAWGNVFVRLLQPLGSNPLLLGEVVYDALPLSDLHRDFENVLSENVEVINFYETRKTRILKVWFYQWEEYCVPEQSARLGKSQDIPLYVNHYELNKFTSKDENYRQVLGKLLQILQPLALQKQQRFYSVPVATVDSYIERATLSAAIEEKLRVRHHKATVPYAVAIHGLGGAGKSQLALKYVEDHQAEYDLILWIEVRDEESVRSSFERCASELRLSVDRGVGQGIKLVDSPAVQAVLRWLRNRKETDGRWLAIVDSADNVNQETKGVVPTGPAGAVIITSQDRQASRLIRDCEVVEVGHMEPVEAISLLLKHLRFKINSAPKDVLENCSKIAEQLEYLALAIDLAGAYMGNAEDPKQAPQQYLVDYVKHKDDLLQNEQFRGLSTSDKTVWTVWDTTLERIERSGGELRPGMLLALLAHFRGGVVEDELLRLASQNLSVATQIMCDDVAELPSWLPRVFACHRGEWDDFDYRQARDILLRYSLLKRTHGEWYGVSMHRLVQWRAMRSKPEAPWDRWHVAIVVAAYVSLSRNTENPQFRRHLLTHMPDVTIERLKELGLSDERMMFLWVSVVTLYIEEELWKEAETLLLQVINTLKTKLRADHSGTLTSMNNLASTYKHQGRWEDAETLDVQALEVIKIMLGMDNPDTAIVPNLALIYSKQGRLEDAEALYVQVIETYNKKLGVDHPDTLMSMHNLALIYSSQGRLEDAEALNLQVMETWKTKLGVDHPNMLISMHNLALIYSSQGRLEDAEALNVQVMETRKTKLGADHPDTLRSMNCLALNYANQDQLEDAEALFVQVMETRKTKLGADHPDTLKSMNCLALNYINQGRCEGAEVLNV